MVRYHSLAQNGQDAPEILLKKESEKSLKKVLTNESGYDKISFVGAKRTEAEKSAGSPAK